MLNDSDLVLYKVSYSGLYYQDWFLADGSTGSQADEEAVRQVQEQLSLLLGNKVLRCSLDRCDLIDSLCHLIFAGLEAAESFSGCLQKYA